MSDAAGTDLQELPSMSEKVKFWEEQDKINQALIPRVIEMADKIEDLSRELAEINDRISATEARVLEETEEREKERAERFRKQLEELSSQVESLKGKAADTGESSSRALQRIERVAWVALTVSVISMLTIVSVYLLA